MKAQNGLTHAATIAAENGRSDLAVSYWQKAVTVNPGNAGYRQELATLFARKGDWAAARAQAEQTSRQDPSRAQALAIEAIACVRSGDTNGGDKLFRKVELLAPANLSDLRRWYTTERSRP